MSNQDQLETLILINRMFFDLNDLNFNQLRNSIINKYEKNYSLSFNLMISQMLYTIFDLRINDFNIYLNLIKEIEKYEKNKIKSKIIDVITIFLINKNTHESFWLLEKMYELHFIEPKINKSNLYFAHYMSKEEIKKFIYSEFLESIIENYDELSKNNWELHKQLIEEGVNPNEIAKIIRNDEIEKLQEISPQANFDFNQRIEPSLYERCSFINESNVTLINYAAFFGSVKCFKYLLTNGANVNNTGKYAVASGNLEIIHLCEQNHSSFEYAYETAIQFHKNNIFKYLYENKVFKNNNLEELGKFCILYHNYEIFSFLLEEGLQVNDGIINESAKIGNIFLVKYFLEFNPIPKDILIYSTESGNNELVKFILEHKKIDINYKNIY